ncbi:MAG: cyclase family protein [Proteobacteria bacterium]|nr:cyclase family protein [Pseudomonadota bacterium]
MKTVAVAIAASLLGFAADAAAQSWRPPAPSERCPSKWGAADQRGAGNHMTPANVLRAARLIKTGQAFELAHVLGPEMVLNAGRQYEMHVKRTTGPFGDNKRYSNEELVTSEIGQVGTQFDGFAHQALDRLFYNCISMDEIATRTGFTKLGVENVGTLMTRGVLIDVAGLKGVEILPINYEITVADLEQALQKQGGLKLQAGDAVLINTGWGKHWGVDNKLFVSGCPGIGVAAAEWLLKQDPMLLGSDNFPVEIAPNPDKSINLPVHNMALTVAGVHLLENLRLEELARARAYEFALVVQPLKLKGATGSTVAPTAIR